MLVNNNETKYMDNLRLFKIKILFANKSNKLGLLIYFFYQLFAFYQ